MKSLKKLDLFRNAINDISVLSKVNFTVIYNLDLYDNKIEDINAFKDYKYKIMSLNLLNNNINYYIYS